MDENTIFETAPLTKTITAAAALKFVEREELVIDTPLAEYLPYPKLSGDDRYKKITARHVLTHTTCLPNWENRLIREPGKLYGYSGEGFLYLGRTIEKFSGMSLQDFARKKIFEPLGIICTSYIWNDLYAENGPVAMTVTDSLRSEAEGPNLTEEPAWSQQQEIMQPFYTP